MVVENKILLRINNTHPPSEIQIKGMDKKKRVFIFGPKSMLWDRKEKIRRTTRTTEYREFLVMDSASRIA